MSVVKIEVTPNYGNGKSYYKKAADGACASDNFPHPRDRHYVSIAYCCHGDEGPPKGLWD